MTIDWHFIGELEGFALNGYVPVPETSQSGVTIATGIDLGQFSAQAIDAWPISVQLKAKLKPYAGLRRFEAVAYLRDHPLTLSQAEAEELDAAQQREAVAAIAARYDAAAGGTRFEALPDQAQTVICSVAFQYGSDLARRTPRFWSCVVRRDWAATVAELRNFGDAYATRRNREADLLSQIVA